MKGKSAFGNSEMPVPPQAFDLSDTALEANASGHAVQAAAGVVGSGQAPGAGGSAVQTEELDKRDVVVVGLSILQALLWALVFNLPDVIESDAGVPGIGVTLLALVGFACAYGLARDRLLVTPSTICLNVATLLLALSFALFANADLRLLNVLALWLVGTYTVFVTTGTWAKGWARARVFADALGLFFKALFCNLATTLRVLLDFVRTVLRRHAEGCKREPRGIALGICLAMALLILVMPLLTGADLVFGALFSGLQERVAASLQHLDLGRGMSVALEFVVAAPLLCSLLYGTLHAQPYSAAEPGGKSFGIAARIQPYTVLIVLAAANALYSLFVAVQFVYLFGGNEAPAMHGGYAEYARSGFFELVAVAVINTALGLLAAKCTAVHDTKRMVLRVLTVALVVLTGVILVSAAWRMSLYIAVFGFSEKRLATLFIMVFCATVLVAVLVKLFVTGMGFFRVCFTAALTLWLVFVYMNPAAFIANCNVDAYLSGQTQNVDVWYVDHLGAGADKPLRRLVDEADGFVRNEAWVAIEQRAQQHGATWQYWNLEDAQAQS